ncbi:Putative ABC transporter [Acididesulfobacillus acetoxydans]|uniref:ABC transporter n=1 Tax=Acididesulfobacillus acetoxydans TaxID=1561005 RepID=A0A8S0W4Y7_9FIRM|nr:ABC transporter ATP-binding protein [Acididesulfobacillus acetoxydans]CAA7602688.1 Putative ABC transporter [Acididesulfobacillus acetoxydans]CEJ06455.1 ABC transporter related protein [Acididesulfobacillus acetoxydans]
MSSVLELKGIEKSFGGHPVLRQVEFALEPGKVVGLLGPNGAGKSTLLKIAVGLLMPDAGQVRVFGEPPSWQSLARIAFLPDRGHFARGLKVEAALAMAARLYDRFDRGLAEAVLKDAHLRPGTRLSELSRGQEARLHLALCVARHPELLILDEPLSGLDILSREAMVETVIGTVSDEAPAVLITTHDLDEVEGHFDEVILLQEGKVVLKAEAESLRVRYGSLRQMYKEVMQP